MLEAIPGCERVIVQVVLPGDGVEGIPFANGVGVGSRIGNRIHPRNRSQSITASAAAREQHEQGQTGRCYEPGVHSTRTSDHRNKSHRLQLAALEAVLRAPHADQSLALAGTQGNDETRSGGKLLEQCLGYSVRRGGDDDAVVRGVLRPSRYTVAVPDAHVVNAQTMKVFPGSKTPETQSSPPRTPSTRVPRGTAA